MPRRLAILIQNHKLTPEQYLKLFGNPVSGIACDMNGAGTNYDYAHFGRFHLKNIRYSKSMIMKALSFWVNQLHIYYKKISRIYNPLVNLTNMAWNELQLLIGVHEKVQKMPDTFLFSHRHIEEVNINHYRKFGGSGIAETNYLLNEKYKDIGLQTFRPQEGTLDPFVMVKTSIGIEFTVFPCEHPYIPKQKISKVGITDNGNVYILHPVGKKD